MSTQQLLASQEKYRLDYQAPKFWTVNIDLDFQLDEHSTRVQAISRICRNGQHNEPLILDGEALELISVQIDDCEFIN